MLRITRVSGGTSDIVRIEGALRGAWIDEARDALIIAEQLPPVRLDLGDVTFADEAGISLLREALSRGARLVACSPFLAAMLGIEGS